MKQTMMLFGIPPSPRSRWRRPQMSGQTVKADDAAPHNLDSGSGKDLFVQLDLRSCASFHWLDCGWTPADVKWSGLWVLPRVSDSATPDFLAASSALQPLKTPLGSPRLSINLFARSSKQSLSLLPPITSTPPGQSSQSILPERALPSPIFGRHEAQFLPGDSRLRFLTLRSRLNSGSQRQ